MGNIAKGFATIGKALVKHGPEILTALGILGLVSSGVSAVKNTPKALEALKQAEDEGEVLTVKVKIKRCWKFYIFPILIALVSIISIIFARKIDGGRTAALLTTCKLTEEAYSEFKDEAKEVAGEKGVEKIEQRIAQRHANENQFNESDVIYTGAGNTLYFEEYSGRYFRANRDYIDRAKNNFNSKLIDNDTMSINDYLECFNLPSLDDRTTGRILGWRLDKVKWEYGQEMPKLKFQWIELESGEPCGFFRYEVEPWVDYDSYY